MADNTGKPCRDRLSCGGGGSGNIPALRELRVHTIAVVNQKGGCGKTTSAINLSGVFASRGYRTLLVDLDPQAHCAAGLAIPEQRIDKHIGDAMLAPDNSPIDADRLLWRVSRNLDLAPSTVRLAALEAARGELAQKPDAESRLKHALSRFAGQYDVCLIDCSPAIGLLTFNALVAADEILIPVETAFFSLHGAEKQVNTIKAVAKRLNVQPTYRLLPTMHEPSSALARDLLEELRRRFPGRVTPVVIRMDSSLREAASFGQPVVEYSSDSLGARDYGDLATFLVEHSLGRKDGRVSLGGTVASVTGIESISPRPAHAAAMPEIHIVPGIADRAAVRAAKVDVEPLPSPVILAVHASPVASHVAAPVAGSAWMHAAPVVDASSTFTPTRAADLVARAKKLHAKAAETSASMNASGFSGGGTATAPSPAVEPARASSQRDSASQTLPPFHASASTSTETSDSIWYGVRFTPRGVVFRQPLTLGRNVRIAGEFNNWSDVATPLRPHPTLGLLEGAANVPAGSSQYRVVVDTQWIADPYNPLVAPNPFGGANSILFVPEIDSPPPPPAAAMPAGVHS